MYIEPFTPTDLTSLAGLQPEGWPDIVPAYSFYVNSPFCFPIKAVLNTKIVGIGTTIMHKYTAWLAHIIVDSKHRNKGIGGRITQSLVESLQAKDCETINLIATDLGAPVYEKIGFETQTHYLFFNHLKSDPSWQICPHIFPLTAHYKEQIAILDQQVTGEERMMLLEPYLTSGYIYQDKQGVEGFYLPTLGEGLIIAKTNIAGIELLKLRLATKDHAAFPVDNVEATQFLYQHNFKEVRSAKRMSLGKKRPGLYNSLYNRIGGNLG
ncbi:GNAT family N-acetyltransferase [Rhodocytophaga aerolata]|uniref:GNAT family N-acetyltransferase n=1 Tax=Rhodocytophaga aerolata TaxID=455078 RepID=A0ABT8RI27_9BACT|nr:GNAT family N-acetyltransferase [Rhodocytophaga aerolata]MDO1450823.1 GNAT family N-acetyltransferase [Rhodocytophaga aerolata]